MSRPVNSSPRILCVKCHKIKISASAKSKGKTICAGCYRRKGVGRALETLPLPIGFRSLKK